MSRLGYGLGELRGKLAVAFICLESSSKMREWKRGLTFGGCSVGKNWREMTRKRNSFLAA